MSTTWVRLPSPDRDLHVVTLVTRAGTCLCHGVSAISSCHPIAVSSLGATPTRDSAPVGSGYSRPMPLGRLMWPGCIASSMITVVRGLAVGGGEEDVVAVGDATVFGVSRAHRESTVVVGFAPLGVSEDGVGAEGAPLTGRQDQRELRAGVGDRRVGQASQEFDQGRNVGMDLLVLGSQ